MKKIFFPFLIIFFMSCTVVSGNPSIYFEKLEHDFGTIKQEKIVTESVKFKNNGNTDLIIKKIERSCGCTGTKINKDKILPGEEAILEISFNSGHYNGRITRKIFIHTNIPDKEMITFTIKANVKK